MPVRAVVLALHVRSSRALWGAERQLAWHPTHPQVSSVSRRRAWPITPRMWGDKRNLLIPFVLMISAPVAPSLISPEKPRGGRAVGPRAGDPTPAPEPSTG